MKKNFSFYNLSAALLSLGAFLIPSLVFAQGLIPCDKNCGFNEFVGLINKLIQFSFVLMVAVAGIVFAYAGAKYVFSASQEGERKEANEMMWKVVVGFIWAMIAWLVVTFILKELFEPGFYKAFF